MDWVFLFRIALGWWGCCFWKWLTCKNQQVCFDVGMSGDIWLAGGNEIVQQGGVPFASGENVGSGGFCVGAAGTGLDPRVGTQIQLCG